MFRQLWMGCALCVLLVGGCGPRPVTGGTPGTLHSRNLPLADLQVVVYRAADGEFEALGMAQTDIHGAFELVTNGARGPLHLAPGEYRFTVETAGSPARIPASYARPESTPLQRSWTTSDRFLDLEVNDITLP
jgi:hypothetical protein